MTEDCRHIRGKPIELVQVLVAEDNPLNQQLVRCYFEQIGCSADLAEDGVEAIRLFQLNRYDLVFLDCQMPKLDGFETARKIREFEQLSGLRSPIPIIALTAKVEESDREDCLSAGMNEWLTKPFTVDQLSETLEYWLGADGAGKAEGPDPNGHDGKRSGRMRGPLEQAGGPVDIPTLDAIRALETPENPRVFSDIIDTYISSAASLLDRLAKASESGGAAEIAVIAHSLKSSSANVGAILLSDVCRELEKRTSDGDLSRAPELCDRVQLEFETARRFLEAEAHRG